MSSEFFFSLLRISCTQIFRAAGIDRCSPMMLNTMTDLLLRHLTLLSTQASKYAELSGRNEVIIQDLVLAMQEVGGGIIRPRARLDPYGVDPNGIQGFLNFIEWAKGPVPTEARRISSVPLNAITNNTISTTAAVVPTTNKDDKDGVDESTTTVVTVSEEDSQWLTHLMKKQVGVGHEKRFNGTVLSVEEETILPELIKIATEPIPTSDSQVST